MRLYKVTVFLAKTRASRKPSAARMTSAIMAKSGVIMATGRMSACPNS